MIVIKFNTAQFFQLSVTANNLDRAIVAFPYRHRRCPKTITTEIPIWCLLDILRKSPILEMWWEPIDMLVLLQHQRFAVLDIEEPRWDGTIHDALSAAGVKWVFVADVFNLPTDTLFHQILGDKLVVIPYFQASIVGVDVVPVIIDNVERSDTVGLAQFEIVFTVSWRTVNNARTRFVRDKISSVYLVDSITFWPCAASV